MSTPKSILSAALSLLLLGSLWLLIVSIGSSEQISFNEEVRPILNQHCLSCHGGVRQNGGFSLLFEEDAYAPTESGEVAIVPGNARKSELIRRLLNTDPEARMPYEAKPLSREEIDILTRWINQGAIWETHWAYRLPFQKEPPYSSLAPIDAFVAARLANASLAFNPPAEKPALLRRISLDLTGLPPDSTIAWQFMNDTTEEAIPHLVDQLLDSPHFGERWASMWLDLARYADSKGYEKDLNRQIWPYRDWVIRAFNQDMPFDQFSVLQLAGDLLPNPSEDQLIATGFLRNSMANDEGGTNDEEFRVAAQIERVGTSWEVWMGTTMACVQCHSHPYDPFRMDDFYSFMAFFNNTSDNDLYNEQPVLVRYPDSLLSNVQDRIDWIVKQANASVELADTFFHSQTRTLLWQLGFRRIEGEDFQAHSPLIELNTPLQESVSQIQDSSWTRYDQIDLSGIAELRFHYATPHSGGYIDVYIDSLYGKYLGTVRADKTGKWADFRSKSLAISSTEGVHDVFLHFRIAEDFNNELFRLDWWQLVPEQSPFSQGSTAFQDSLLSLYQLPSESSLILQELSDNNRLKTHLFERGNWLNPQKEVETGLPEILQRGEPQEDRLALARWVVDPQNPLTSRVIVNRFWAQLFGQGLVKTLEDFGSQGDQPTHPDLLDWLAVEFSTEYGWSVKRLLKEIILSQTYQQSTRNDSLRQAIDPYNRLLSRGPRIRLNAEQLRDQTLAASGLLDRSLYGPPVRVEAAVSNDPYKQGNLLGFNPYRRSVYTYIKRTFPVPFMVTFDSPQRNICTSRRIRTNTPLQALSLLNDSLLFRSAQYFVNQLKLEAPAENCIQEAYQKLFFQPPDATKQLALLSLYQTALTEYQTKPDLLEALPDEGFERSPKRAALSLVANSLFNLDEWITKP